MSATHIYYTSVLLPKSGSDPEECQDALATPNRNDSVAICDFGSPLRFAVADGLTTSFYSGCWAGQLVSLFGAGQLRVENGRWIDDQNEWTRMAHTNWEAYLKTLQEAGDLGFISKNHLLMRTRSAATFCGIEVQAPDDASNGIPWRLIAVGDSCAIHLTSSQPHGIAFSYPCKTAAAFSSATFAISNYEDALPEQFKEETPPSHLMQGDVVFLATDALCEWMLKLAERGKPIWKSVIEAASNGHDAFQELVGNARRDQNVECRLKDDDVALVVISVGEQYPAWIRTSDWVYETNIAAPTENQTEQASKFAESLSSSPGLVAAPTVTLQEVDANGPQPAPAPSVIQAGWSRRSPVWLWVLAISICIVLIVVGMAGIFLPSSVHDLKGMAHHLWEGVQKTGNNHLHWLAPTFSETQAARFPQKLYSRF